MSATNKTVPNHSEPSFRPGRPAKLSDEELLDLVESLALRYGRTPTLDAIIEAAGGCQRSRAVKARHAHAQATAKNNIAITLKLPDTLEHAHRKLMAQWLALAREQATLSVNEEVRDAEQRSIDAEQSLSDARARLDSTSQQNDELRDRIRDMNLQVSQISERLASLTEQLTRCQAVADERARVIQQLTNI